MTNQLDIIFAALSDPTRRAVVEHLARDPATVSDLHAPHPIALPTFMRHLKVLEASGLVLTQKQGRIRTARLNPAALAPVETWVRDHKSLWDGRLDRLSQLADDMERTRS